VIEKMFYMVCVSQEELDSRPCGRYEVELDRKRGKEYVVGGCYSSFFPSLLK
jgi:hypothetical protein